MESNNSVLLENNSEFLEGEDVGRWVDARESWFFFASLAVVLAYMLMGFASDALARYL